MFAYQKDVLTRNSCSGKVPNWPYWLMDDYIAAWRKLHKSVKRDSVTCTRIKIQENLDRLWGERKEQLHR